MGKDVGYILPHTHWDREWRYPIWKTRMLLVEFMEQLLDILERDPEYHCFLLDGQVVPIEDYLQVKPQDRERITGFIKDGRIAVGPWYTLPDLYPLDGESLVRNLLKGIRLSRAYGSCLNIGYNSFGWGQIAQFPQIYKGFGFDFCICAKKVSEERAPQSEFIWEGSDGTRMLTSRLGEFARANLFFHAYIDVRFGVRFLSDEFRYSPERAGVSIHSTAPEVCDQDYFMLRPAQGHHWDRLREGMERAWAATNDTALSSRRLFPNGCDFSTPQPDLTEFIAHANELHPDRQFVNAPLEQYRDDLMTMLDQDKLMVVKGELRDGPSCDCSGNALASRIYLKQLNKQAENLLIRHAEPLAVIASLLGAEYPNGFLALAWEYLLQSHPHDSINGVTQDKTANDVEYRLNQAIELGQTVYDSAVMEIIKRIDFSGQPADGAHLVVFNPCFQAESGVIEACIDTPSEWAAWDIEVVDEHGRIVPLQHLSRREADFPTHDLNGRPWPTYTDRHMCLIEAEGVPGLGYKTYTVRPSTIFKRNHHYWYTMRKTQGEEIGRGDNLLENDYLRVAVNPNGTFNLLDKEQGRSYPGLHYFEDTGDVGNYWAYYPPYANQTHTTLTSAPRVWMAENGSLSATIAIEYSFELPASGHEPLSGVRGESRRSDKTETLRILSNITLRKNARRVDIHTTMRNNIENHRLRVAFPTGIDASMSHAGGHFTVDERPMISARDEAGEYFNEMQTLPMGRFVDISDVQAGLGLLSDSVTEFELRDDPAHTVYLTLFRAMGNMIVTGWECVNRFPRQKGSQLLRDMEFDYSVYPHAGDWSNGTCQEARRRAAPLTAYQTMGALPGTLPLTHGFCTISEPDIVVSALKRAEDRSTVILRLYNPTETAKNCEVTFAKPLEGAWEADLNETRGTALQLNDLYTITLSCSFCKIITVEVEFST